MGESEIFEVLRASLWTGVLMGLPILGVTLVLGFLIGLVQALTSVQEMTLTFVPKLGAIAIAYWITMGYMSEALVTLWRDRIIPIVAGSG